MDALSNIAVAAGLAWGSGMRAYAVIFIAGLLGRMGMVDLPGQLDLLQHPLVVGASGFMLAVEFLADKVPALDSLWDGLHTFIRIPAGALLAALAMAGHGAPVELAAALLGGTLAAGTHAAKSGGRALINTSPEPLSNWGASLSEDALVITGLYTAFHHPVVFLILLTLFGALLVWLLPKMWRGLRAVFSRLLSIARSSAPQ